MRINTFSLTIIFPAMLTIISGCSKNPNETGVEIFPDMVHSVAFEAYSENPNTKDGKTMLLPPRGTIARGKLPFPYGKGESEAKRAEEELVNPYTKSETRLNRGKEVYENFCLVCHGSQGKGDGPIIPKFPNPPSLTGKRIRKYKDGRLFHIVSRGSGDMPSHAEQISEEDRWNLIQYVRFIQETYSRK